MILGIIQRINRRSDVDHVGPTITVRKIDVVQRVRDNVAKFMSRRGSQRQFKEWICQAIGI